MQRSSWHFETLVEVTQRLAVEGIDIHQVDAALEPCGDMASAITADDSDSRFAQIVLLISPLEKQTSTEDLYTSLYELDNLGVPAFQFLAEFTGTPLRKIKDYARDGRLKAEGVRDILLASFTLHYGGLAAKLAQKHVEKN